jgi:NTP pyrophosphatase (non-canonical NTP hydrolase)
MNATTYQAKATATARVGTLKDSSCMSAMGLAGEAGEVVDLLKKHHFHGHDLDCDKLADELGDVLWYVADLCKTHGLDMGAVMARNLDKLARRYPEGFSQERSRNRGSFESEGV